MAFCKYCGKEVNDGTKICVNCGKEIDTNLYAPPKHEATGFTVIENEDLRALARQQLKGAWGKMALAVFIVSGAFYLGFSGMFLKRMRGEEVFVENIFDGFKRFLPSLLLMFFYTLFIVLWSLLLIIPGIIKSLGYSMAFFIMNDNPEIKPLEAIKRSQIMMRGYKGKLFMLCLSFIGWGLLGLLTLGIGYLWLTPYIGLSISNFYENLKQNQEKVIT